MSKKNEDFSEEIELDDDTIVVPAQKFDYDLEPTNWASERERLDPRGEKLKAEELVGQTFDILQARQFESSFPGQPYAYWIVGRHQKSGKLFNTVLGGSALIGDIDTYLELGIKNPMRVTLKEEAGGKYGRYYVFA